MFDLKDKYSGNLKSYSSTYNTKSILQPDLSKIDLGGCQIQWYRQPPVPYECEGLSFNLNRSTYKCSCLDFECSIICEVVQQKTGQLIQRFDYGPIESYLFNSSSSINEFRVNIVLFGQYKKCIFSCKGTPTLININNNNNSYTFTQQDIKSIYLLSEQETTLKQQQQSQGRFSLMSGYENKKFITSKTRKTLVVGNLFQRLILLKLFNEIPTIMYSHSTELLEIIFYDEMSCNIALMALNRFKYDSKVNKITNYTFGALKQSAVTKIIMKNSNASLSKIHYMKTSQHYSKSNEDQTFHLSTKRQFFPLSMLKSVKKYPKQSGNSDNQVGKNNSNNRLVQSKILPIGNQTKLKSSLVQNTSKFTSINSPESNSVLSDKQPKVSFLSTDINSTKQPRQQKVSFPQTSATQNLKSSELIIKPNQFKACFMIRRSQQEIKTPRMDIDDCGNNQFTGQQPIRKKSLILFSGPDEISQDCNYVNQFENLLFQKDEAQIKEQELCLNDSFIRMQEQEEKEKQKKKIKQNQNTQTILLRPEIDNIQVINQSVPTFTTTLTPQRLTNSMHSLKETLQTVLIENSQLKIKNEALRKQIEEIKIFGGKKEEITKYQNQIQKMKQIKRSLILEIQSLKVSACEMKSQCSQRQITVFESVNYLKKVEKQKIFSNQIEIGSMKQKDSVHPQRQDRQQFQQPSKARFAIRRSQEQSCPSFILKQCGGQSGNNNSCGEEERRFPRFQGDQTSIKFKSNQPNNSQPRQISRFDQVKK